MGSDDDRWGVLWYLALSRCRQEIANPKLREFLMDGLIQTWPKEYRRLLEIEHMTSLSMAANTSPLRLEHWIKAEKLVDACLSQCQSQEELEAVVTSAERLDLRSDLAIWVLLDRSHKDLENERDSPFCLLAAAKRAIEARLEEEENPKGRHRRDETTDLYAICTAERGNRRRVAGDVAGGFKLAQRAKGLVRPGGNQYILGKVYSYFASAATAAGEIQQAEEKASRSLDIFERLALPTEIGSVLNKLDHISKLRGISFRDELEIFLERYKNSPLLSTNIIVHTQLNLVGNALYFHEGEGVDVLLKNLSTQDLGIVEELWLKHFRALFLLNNGEPKKASTLFEQASAGFLEAGKPVQYHFVMLFETLSLLEAQESERAAIKAGVAATFFSSSSFYSGLPAYIARRLENLKPVS